MIHTPKTITFYSPTTSCSWFQDSWSVEDAPEQHLRCEKSKGCRVLWFIWHHEIVIVLELCLPSQLWIIRSPHRKYLIQFTILLRNLTIVTEFSEISFTSIDSLEIRFSASIEEAVLIKIKIHCYDTQGWSKSWSTRLSSMLGLFAWGKLLIDEERDAGWCWSWLGVSQESDGCHW